VAPLLLGTGKLREPAMPLNLAIKAFDVLVVALIFTTLG
jgi:hypothetical protein